MELKEIAKKHRFDQHEFANYLNAQGYPLEQGGLFKGLALSDSLVTKAVGDYSGHLRSVAADAADAAALAEAEEQNKQVAMSQMLITSGFTFDGYTITKYSGYISGDDVVEIPRGTKGIFSSSANVGEALSASLVKIRRQALKELKEAAYDLGCNAVIGVDFDYITLEPETANTSGGTVYLPYVFCVTANGNAVVIEKD